MARTVLITQGMRPFAQRVGKLLQVDYAVRFGSADEIPHVLLQLDSYIQIPGVDTGAFEHEVLRICLDNRIDVLIPLGEKEIDLLDRAQQLFAEYNIAVWLPDATHPGVLNRVKNPERRLPLLILDRGVAVAGATESKYRNTLSGVFTQPTSDELALCCIAD